MKVLLINPEQEPDIDNNLPKFVDQSRGSLPPLGLLYVASATRKAGHDVKVADCSIGDNPVQVIRGFRPDIVGITATTFTLLKALKIARLCHQEGCRTVLGGVHASIYPLESLALPEIDYTLSGEGEHAFPVLLRKLENGKVHDKYCELADGYIYNLDALEFPDRTMTDWRKYQSALDSTGYVTTILTSRGCPFHCTFCHRPHLGKMFRPRSPDNVIKELKEIRELGIREITFYDDTFAVDRERVFQICDRIIREKLGIVWDMRTRVDLVDKDMLRALCKAGCKQIRYGVESSDNETLRKIAKGITIEQAQRAVKWTKDAGIETFTYFIIGSPGETMAHWQRTIEFSKRLNPDYCYFAIMTPYPKTPLYEMWLRGDGSPRPDHWLDFAKNPREIETPYYQDWINRDVLEDWLKRAYKEFYLRPSYLARKLLKVRSAKEIIRGIKAVGRLWR
jgi:radical SAM superfamily enzyme YgiQ (UPF0313 family)